MSIQGDTIGNILTVFDTQFDELQHGLMKAHASMFVIEAWVSAGSSIDPATT